MSLLTVKEVAGRLKVSQACVYQLVAEQKLAHVRIGCGRGAIRIAERDLESFLESCRVEPSGTSIPHSLKHIKLGA